MKRIDISTPEHLNTFTLVDDEDYVELMKHKWHIKMCAKQRYAVRKHNRKALYMHREITTTPKGVLIDHKNGNGLDNRKQNLRNCTKQENARNTGKISNNKSGYKGVSWAKKANLWRAQIQTGEGVKYLGCFFCLIKAAKAYDTAARKYHGEFANTNFKG